MRRDSPQQPKKKKRFLQIAKTPILKPQNLRSEFSPFTSQNESEEG